jgi:hypothetical protein
VTDLPAPFRPDEIIEALAEHGVKFVLVGGRAAEFHGATRPTQDADIVVDFGTENLWKLSAALDALGWRYRLEGLSDDEARAATAGQAMHPQLLERGSIHTFMTDAGPLDVLRMIPTLAGETPGRDYESLAGAAISHQVLPGLTVRLAALGAIIESKQWADRDKDREALPELLELQRRQASDDP